MRVIAPLAAVMLALTVVPHAVLYVWRWRMLRRDPACFAERLPVLVWLIAFSSECIGGMLAGVLSLSAGDDRLQVRGERPLILVHGWGHTAGALRPLAARLQHDGWGPIRLLRLPAFSTSLRDDAAALRAAVDEMAACAPATPLVVVGYGRGGLVARLFLRRYPARSVRRLVTIATPHHGTVVARVFGGRARELRPDSPALAALNAADRLAGQFDVVNLRSSFDAVILPPSSGRYEPAFTIELDDVGHYTMLFSPKAYGLLLENLRAPM